MKFIILIITNKTVFLINNWYVYFKRIWAISLNIANIILDPCYINSVHCSLYQINTENIGVV